MNFFEPKNAAERYSKGRPYFHELSIAKIKEFLQIEKPLNKVLDVACGTGLSSKALLKISNKIEAIDSSNEMLKNAEKHELIHYSVSSAEQLNFSANEFELITVCSGVHWFKIEKFLNESFRVLKDESCLALYDNFFLAEMEGNLKFKIWYEQNYLIKFPAPKRVDNFDWSSNNLMKFGLENINEIQFENAIYFSLDELVLYFTTQSNITDAVENRGENYLDIEKWLLNELSSFFTSKSQKFFFGNWIRFIQKKAV